MSRRTGLTGAILIVAFAVFMVYQWWPKEQRPGTVLDEARRAHRGAETFGASTDPYFRAMDRTKDGPLLIAPGSAEMAGRNTWMVWTGGDDRLWNRLSVESFGALDFLKTLSSHAGLKANRDNRWRYLGLVNEPCFDKAMGPNSERFGLWLDRRQADCPPDPFEDESKYPGVRIGSRGTTFADGQTLPVGSFYGYASGIVGLRLFPNPAFDEAAEQQWDAERYYTDAGYYARKGLIKPYRVGMSCAFCHVGPNPLSPPHDPEHPEWGNLSSNVGAQYFRVDRIFDWDADPSTYVFQMFHTARPGSLDTSLVSTDNINNPRTMNAVYGLQSRLEQASQFGKEALAGGSLGNQQLSDFVPPTSPLAASFIAPATVLSPRVLKDGADSVGALGALDRVYLNIGLFSEEWLLHFKPLIGGTRVTPIEIAVARKNSAYWQATEAQTPGVALFFMKSTAAHKLKDAPGGEAYLSRDPRVLTRGGQVFAENCARCHSSKLPTPTKPMRLFSETGCSGPDYLTCWKEYWIWTKTEEFKSQIRTKVAAPDFLNDNFLSAEFRVPVTLLQSNACSPLASNAIRDNIWDNFSSETYKQLPSVGTITVYDPITGDPKPYAMPAGGRGYTRPASLISLWSTAPFLLNNSVGRLNPGAPDDTYNPSPTVANRMAAFQDAIEKMLWPEKRDRDPALGNKVPGVIDRTTQLSYVRVAPGYFPAGLERWGKRLFPRLFDNDDEFQIGPFPRGTPVGLLASLMIQPEEMGFWDRLRHDRALAALILELKRRLDALGPQRPGEGDDDYNRRATLVLTEKGSRGTEPSLASQLMALSKCPDYVVNRGHYFGTGYDGEAPLSDADKRALIEFLKTF